MSSETTRETITVKTEGAAAAAGKQDWKCPLADRHIHRDDVQKVWKECQEESFWYRAVPFSLGGMAVTGGLIYSGIWKSSKRFGPFPKLAVAGILGFALGKASYVGTCRGKFQQLNLPVGPGSGPWSAAGSCLIRNTKGCSEWISLQVIREKPCTKLPLEGATRFAIIM